jgi:hypothetical protein
MKRPSYCHANLGGSGGSWGMVPEVPPCFRNLDDHHGNRV